MSLRFERDPRKAASNARKHGVTFDEAATSFGDPRSITIADPDHSLTEFRFVTIGLSLRGRLLVVVHTDRDRSIRIVSARKATRREAEQYAKD